jgi:putative SOS response-associated peptidase YedK
MLLLKWTMGAWMADDDPAALLRPVHEDALREWTVSTRVNKAGVGDDDPAVIEQVA